SWVDRDGSRWLILDSSMEELEGAPAFDRTALLPEPAEETAAADDTTDMMAADPAMEEEASDMAASDEPAAAETEQTAEATSEEVDPAETAAIDPNSWTPVTNQLSAEELIGTRVYGANDEDIG